MVRAGRRRLDARSLGPVLLRDCDHGDARSGTAGALGYPPLSEDELAFYDAVAENESAVHEMGTGQLAEIARDLVRSLRRDVMTGWVSATTMYAPSSAAPSNACSPRMATHRTPSPGRSAWC